MLIIIMMDVLLCGSILFIDYVVAPNLNYFVKILAIDSVYNAINFVKIYFNEKNLTNSQIVLKSNLLYDGSLTDRYIYYALTYCLYNTICTFFWLTDVWILYYVYMISVMPCVINKIFKSNFFNIIREKKEMFVKCVIAKILTAIIKFFSKMYLRKNISYIKYTEILQLLVDYRQTVGYFGGVVKNLLIILILSHVKTYSPRMYYDIIKYIYNYTTGDLLSSFNSDSAKMHLINIINNKEWSEFTKPNTIGAMVYVYQTSTGDVDIFKLIMDEINFGVIKMFSVWTLASLVDNIYCVPLISLMLLLHNYDLKSIIVTLCVIPLCYVYESYMVMSMLCQFGPRIIFNRISYKVAKEVHQVMKLCDVGKLKLMLWNALYIGLLKYVDVRAVILNTAFGFIVYDNLENCFIVGSTMLSDFNLVHVMFNTVIVSLMAGVDIDYRKVFDYLVEVGGYGIVKGKIVCKFCYKTVQWMTIDYISIAEFIDMNDVPVYTKPMVIHIIDNYTDIKKPVSAVQDNQVVVYDIVDDFY